MTTLRWRRKRQQAAEQASPPKELSLPRIRRSSSLPELAKALNVPYERAEDVPPLTALTSEGVTFSPVFSVASPTLTQSGEGFSQSMTDVSSPVDSRYSFGRPATAASVSSVNTFSPRKRSRHQPPTFNVLLVGKRNLGKTSFIRTVLQTVKLAPGASKLEAEERIADFESSSAGRTRSPASITVETQEQGERIQLTLHDTPGLDSQYGDELEADRALTRILDFVEAKYQESLQLESQVVRTSGPGRDAHIHACLYFISPTSFTTREPYTPPLTPATTPRLDRSPSKTRSTPPSKSQSGSEEGQIPDMSHEQSSSLSQMSQMDVKLIKRLSRRVNVIPIIARADELTTARLAELKEAVRRDLGRARLDLGALDLSHGKHERPSFDRRSPSPPPLPRNAKDVAEPGNVQQLDPPIKLIKTRFRSRSLSHRRRPTLTEDEELASDAPLEELMPFAVISPEGSQGLQRVFRWGTIDVLNPEHCDVQPLTRVLFRSHMRIFKETTRKRLYETYRTEQLLARRATGLPKNPRETISARDVQRS